MQIEDYKKSQDKVVDSKLILSLFSLGLVSFLSILLETALNVTFSYLIQTYGINLAQASYLTSIFLLALTLMAPLSSFLFKRFNTKILFCAINILFIMGLIICIFGHKFYMLIFARFLQGIAAGISIPLMFNMIIIYSPKRYFGLLMGFCIFLIANAPGLGPLFGGFMMSFYQFEYIFIAVIPFVIFAFLLGIVNIKDSRHLTHVQFSYIEYFLIVMVILLFAMSFKHWQFVILLLPIIIILYKFSKGTVINLEILNNFKFLSGSCVIFFVQFCALSYSLILPNYLVSVLLLDSFQAGKVMLFGSLISACISVISGFLSDKFNPFNLSIFGIFVIVFSTFLFLILDKNLCNFSICYSIFAFGQGFCMAPTVSHIIKITTHKTDANAFINTFQQVFGMLGVVVCSEIFSQNFIYGYTNCIILLLILSIISVFCTFFTFKF